MKRWSIALALLAAAVVIGAAATHELTRRSRVTSWYDGTRSNR